MTLNKTQSFPRQKLPFSKKNKKWRKEHLDWADKNSRLNNETVRKKQSQKKINIDFFNGKIHKDDIKLVLNPTNLESFYVPDRIQHYPIVVPRINVLVGEEKARRFDWKVTINSPTTISSMEDEKRKLVQQKLEEFLTLNYGEEEIEKELQKFGDYLNFEWQDIREKRANVLMKHYIEELNVESKLSDGFMDVCIHGEEGFLCDIRNGNPVFEKLNPLKTYVLKHGYSNRYQDADIIVIDDFWSPGRIVDYYYEDLKPKDIEYIENNGHVDGTSSGRALDGDLFKEDIDDRAGIELLRSQMLEENLDLVQNYTAFNAQGGTYFDQNGNVRVLRVFWRSYKKILKVEYFDENGDKQIKYRNESYKLDKMMGETATTYWISEWWQGTKIGKDVYVDMKPRPIQYNKIGNPGYNNPGVVGRIFNINEQKVVSLLDRAKVFNIKYDAAWHRLMEMYAKWLGPLLELDKAKFPEGWGVTKTMYFAKKAGVLVIDSFNEGKKGQSTGKLAGAVANTTGKYLQSDIANYINTNIQVMQYAVQQMDELLGIPKQRLGAVENRETVGGVEHAIRQSNYVTEALYKQHDEVKKEALTLLLETAKIAVRGNKMKLNYIGDDLINQLIEIDGDEIAEEDYGLSVTNNSKHAKLEQNLEELARLALQNQTIKFSTITKLFTSPSLVEMQRLIEKDEKDMMERNSAAQEEANKLAQEQEANRVALEQAKLKLDEFDITERSRIEELKLIMDASDDEIGGMLENESGLDRDKFDFEKKKHLDEIKQKQAERRDKMAMHKDNLALKRKQINKTPAKK